MNTRAMTVVVSGLLAISACAAEVQSGDEPPTTVAATTKATEPVGEAVELETDTTIVEPGALIDGVLDCRGEFWTTETTIDEDEQGAPSRLEAIVPVLVAHQPIGGSELDVEAGSVVFGSREVFVATASEFPNGWIVTMRGGCAGITDRTIDGNVAMNTSVQYLMSIAGHFDSAEAAAMYLIGPWQAEYGGEVHEDGEWFLIIDDLEAVVVLVAEDADGRWSIDSVSIDPAYPPPPDFAAED